MLNHAVSAEGQVQNPFPEDSTLSLQMTAGPSGELEVLKAALEAGEIPESFKEELRWIQMSDAEDHILQTELLAIAKRLYPDEAFVQNSEIRFFLFDAEKDINAVCISCANPALIGLSRACIQEDGQGASLDRVAAILAHEIAHKIVRNKYETEENTKLEEGYGDLVGVRALMQGGFDPTAMLDLLNLFEKHESSDFIDKVLHALGDPHPLAANRVSLVEAVLTKYELERGSIKRERIELAQASPVLLTLGERQYTNPLELRVAESDYDKLPIFKKLEFLSGLIRDPNNWTDARIKCLARVIRSIEFCAADWKHEEDSAISHATKDYFRSGIDSVEFCECANEILNLPNAKHRLALAQALSAHFSQDFTMQDVLPLGRLKVLARAANSFLKSPTREGRQRMASAFLEAVHAEPLCQSAEGREFLRQVILVNANREPDFEIPKSSYEIDPYSIWLTEDFHDWEIKRGLFSDPKDESVLEALLTLGIDDPEIIQVNPELAFDLLIRANEGSGSTISQHPQEDYDRSRKQRAITHFAEYLKDRAEELPVGDFYNLLKSFIESDWYVKQNPTSCDFRIPIPAELIWYDIELVINYSSGSSTVVIFSDSFLSEASDEYAGLRNRVERSILAELREKLLSQPDIYAAQLPSILNALGSSVQLMDDELRHSFFADAIGEPALPEEDPICGFCLEFSELVGKEQVWSALCDNQYFVAITQASGAEAVWELLAFAETFSDYIPQFIDRSLSTEDQWQECIKLLDYSERSCDGRDKSIPLSFELLRLMFPDGPDAPGLPDGLDFLNLAIGLKSIRGLGPFRVINDAIEEHLLELDCAACPTFDQKIYTWQALRCFGLQDSFTRSNRVLADCINAISEFPKPEERVTAVETVLSVISKSRSKALSSMHERIEDPALRTQLMQYWIEGVSLVLGIDDSSAEFSRKVSPYIEFVKTKVPAVDRRAWLNGLANRIEAQASLTFQFEEALPTLRSEHFKQASLFGGVSELLFELVRSNERFVNIFSHYLLLGHQSPQALERTVSAISKSRLDAVLKRLRMTPEEICDLLYRNFWSSSLEERAVFMKELLTANPDGRLARERDSFYFVLDTVFPLGKKYSEDARNFVSSYVQVLPEYTRWYALAALSASQKAEESDKPVSIGAALATFCELMGPAEIKIGQAATSFLPEALREDMQRLKNRAAEPARWDLFHQIAEIPEEERTALGHIGQILGSASYFVSLGLKKHRGDEHYNQVLQLKRPYVEERAKEGFRRLKNVGTLARRFGSDWQEILDQAQEDAETEGRLELSPLQYETARDLYAGVTVAVQDGKRQRKFKTAVPELLSWGSGFRRISFVPGEHFIDLSKHEDPETLRHRARAILALELSHLVRGRGFDKDRHGGNVKVDNEKIYHLDFGSMSTEKPSHADLFLLGELLYEAGSIIQENQEQKFLDAWNSAIKTRRDAGVQMPPVISQIKRALLSLEEYRRFLHPHDDREIVEAVLKNAHKSVKEGMRAAMKNKEGWSRLAARVIQSARVKKETIDICFP